MSHFAELVKQGLDYANQVKSGVQAIKLDSSVDNAREAQNLRISQANNFRTDALPENGKLHFIDPFGVQKSDSTVEVDYREAQNLRIANANK